MFRSRLLVSHLFLIRFETDNGENALAVRYAKDITIHVALQEETGNGRIYPPYIQINYGVATIDNFDDAADLAVTFSRL